MSQTPIFLTRLVPYITLAQPENMKSSSTAYLLSLNCSCRDSYVGPKGYVCRGMQFLSVALPPEVVHIFLVPSQAPLPEQWQIDREYWDAQLQEPWYINQVEEPENDVGRSILVRWLDPLEGKDEKGWRCRVPMPGQTWCNETIKRTERAITHVRAHLDLKPYPCEGGCSKPNWYVKSHLPLHILTA